MTIEIDPVVARGVATRLSAEAEEFMNLESSVRSLRAAAMLDDHGSEAEFELHEAHPELSSLSHLIRLWADRLETTDADLARQLDGQIAVALGTFYNKVVRDGVSDPSLAERGATETNEQYFVRMTAATTELRLRQLGLLEGETNEYFDDWLLNAARNGVHGDQVIKIADECEIDPSDFDVLNGQERVLDNDGKSFFLLESDLTVDERMKAVEMTYILNAGTGYATADGHEDNNFPATPYSADEVIRIRERMEKNKWTYGDGPYPTTVSQIYQTGGAVVTTPNGMMMAVIGTEPHDLVGADVSAANGGTTYGDLFLLPDRSSDPAGDLRRRIGSGYAGVIDDLDTDRLLHHEEQHSQQWARLGPILFPVEYGRAEAKRYTTMDNVISILKKEKPHPEGPNFYEEQAGLSDGGYGS